MASPSETTTRSYSRLRPRASTKWDIRSSSRVSMLSSDKKHAPCGRRNTWEYFAIASAWSTRQLQLQSTRGPTSVGV